MLKLLVTSFLIQFSYVVAQQGCTVQGQSGTCTNIGQCPQLQSKLSSDKPYVKEAYVACGSRKEGGDIMLCCSEKQIPENCGTVSSFDRIIGGVESAIGAWPWMAVFGTNSGRSKHFFCGGTLITARHVLTAAHCFDRTKPDFVRVGDHNLIRTGECDEWHNCLPNDVTQEVGVSKITKHPQYRKECVGPCNDIAVVRLSDVIRMDGRYVQHICLPRNLQKDVGVSLNQLYLGNEGGVIAGWGRTSNNNNVKTGSDVLMQARLQIGNENRCNRTIGSRRQYPERNSMLCASSCSNGNCKDTCDGDSGGPLMKSNRDKTKWYVLGVTSAGSSWCGLAGQSGRYTNVNFFIDWILKTLN